MNPVPPVSDLPLVNHRVVRQPRLGGIGYIESSMFTVESLAPAILFCVVTMLGWGSWANTQKLAGKTAWPFELYYWDYAIGVFLFSVVFMFTLGSMGSTGMAAIENLRQASRGPVSRAMFSGALFNVANILLVVAIDAATGTEVSIVAPSGAAQSDLQRLALGKLKARLARESGKPHI